MDMKFANLYRSGEKSQCPDITLYQEKDSSLTEKIDCRINQDCQNERSSRPTIYQSDLWK